MFSNNCFLFNLYKILLGSLKKKFFFTFSVLFLFDKVNLCILKNIVYKYIIDISVWIELKKILFFLKFDIYSTRMNVEMVNILIEFLYQIYLNEIDKFCFFMGFVQNKGKEFPYLLKNKKIPFLVSPLHINLKFEGVFRFQKLTKVIGIQNSYFYIKSVMYTRYINFILMTILSSQTFSIFIKNTTKSFLYSKLHLFLSFCELKNIKLALYFLNYKFCFYSFKTMAVFKRGNFSDIATFIKHKLNVFNKINFKYSLYRIYSELSFYVSFNLVKTRICNLFLRDKRIWSYIFQLESKRCFQVFKLIGSFDFLDMTKIDKKISYYSHKRFFSTYIFYLQNICYKLINTMLILTVPCSTQSLDMFFRHYNFSFFTNIVFIKNYINLRSFTKQYENLYSNLLSPCNIFFIIFPFNLLLKKLKLMGFFHVEKNRIIANLRFMFFEDSSLIESYFCLIFVYYYWYFPCNNKQRLNSLVWLFKKSCFFTLSRKHNKTKFWSYKIYTFYVLLHKLCFMTNTKFIKIGFDFLYCKQNSFLLNHLVRFFLFN